MGIFASSKASGGAGGTIDTQARNEAAANKAVLSKIYKMGGDTVDPGSEVFILLDSGAVVNYKNPKTTALTVPDNPTDALLLAAGFTGIAAKELHLHSILANANTLASSDTVFKVAGGKLWKNKVNNPVITLQPTDTAWPDNWEEFKAGAGGAGSGLPDASAMADDTISVVKNKVWTTQLLPDFFNVRSVVEAGALKTGEYGKAEPPANTTYTYNPPAAQQDTWFGVINTGDGVVQVNTAIAAAFPLTMTITNPGTGDFVGQYALGLRKSGNAAYLPAELPENNAFTLSGGQIATNHGVDDFINLEWTAGQLPANGSAVLTIPLITDLQRIIAPDFMTVTLVDRSGRVITPINSDGQTLFNLAASGNAVAIAARGVAFWVSNQAGDAWVFISGDSEVPVHTHDRITDGTTTLMVQNGQVGLI